ncbi:Epsin-2 [Desmophyllum pertusum]|uniref:Epsin-2 n=1 Tax=Desmophyllum pertusum TaxID=174260 RepID=A0A9X0CEH5_9CNID|nr:Epsin-2 [Desmophyllum pertusum]
MSVRRQLKNVVNNYSNAEVKVREATSNDPWGPSSSVMTEIADATYNVVAFSEIMGMIWKRLNDHGKNWRHVYKSLVVLDYIIKTGSERVAQQCRENLYAIQTLKDFQFIDKDGKDQGMNVREKAKQLVGLLKDEDRLKSERARALKAKERFAQASSGIGSDSLKAGGLRDSGSTSDLRLDSSSTPAATVPTSRSWEPGRKVLGAEMDTCRPSNANEEELQLQLALALSKQEAEEKGKMEERDDQRLQLAINQSQNAPPTQEPSLLDVASGGVPMSTQDTFDPWGSTTSAAPQPPMPQPPMPQPDPWGSGGTSSPWGSSPAAPPPLPVNTTQNIFGASNGTSALGAGVGSTDPWGVTPVYAAPTMAPPPSDPWGGGNSFPATAVPQSQEPWGAPQTESFNAFNQTNAVSGLSSQPPLDPFNLANEGQAAENTKQPEEFLDNRVSNLVNLDLLTQKPDPVINPFLSSQPAESRSTNPFVQDKPQAPTLNQLRVQPVAMPSNIPSMGGGDILLPAPLIPDSGSTQQTVQSNPFL